MNESYLDPFHDALDVREDIHPIELMAALIDECIILPSKPVQSPILIALAIMPSKHCSVLPLVINYGESGTGKSTYGKCVHGIWNLPAHLLLAGKTTPTAIRNMLMAMKYGDNWLEGEPDDEQNAILIWDDIDPGILSDSLIQSILKSGYSRKTANIGIASSGGVNQYFNFFSAKFTSTIHPIWTIDELKELKRRSLVIQYKRWDTIPAECQALNNEPTSLIDIDYLDFSGYMGRDKITLDASEVITARTTIVPQLRKAIKAANFPTDFGKLCFDVMTIGVSLGVFSSVNDAIEKLERFYAFQKLAFLEQSEFTLWINSWIDKECFKQSELIQVRTGLEPISIPRRKLASSVNAAIKADQIPNERRNLQNEMKRLGFSLTTIDSEPIFVKD